MAHKLVWDKTKLDCCPSKLSDNLIDLDLFKDRVVHENVNIDNGIKNFGVILYNNASQVYGQGKTVKIGHCVNIQVRGSIMNAKSLGRNLGEPIGNFANTKLRYSSRTLTCLFNP